MGLHRRYERLLADADPQLLAASASEVNRISKELSHLFRNLMKVVHASEGASFSVSLLASDQAQALIGAHAAALDSSFRKVEMSEAMRHRLHRSDYIFSGMKVFHELNEAFPALLGSDGNIKPFEQFYKEVSAIHDRYNRHYLRAEYNFVHASAQMAARWEEFAEDGDDYNLQYRTAGDNRVREEHQALEGVTLPFSDPFWEEFLPPNGWNCRCSVVQVRKSKYPVTDAAVARRRGEDALRRDTRGMFRFNPGTQQKTVPDYNPYTISACRSCPLAKGKSKLAKPSIPPNQLCDACRLIRSKIEESETRRLTREEREEVRNATLSWAKIHLPKVTLPDGQIASRLILTTHQNHKIIVGKTCVTETYHKNLHNKMLAQTMEAITRVVEWLPDATYIRHEEGKHHKFGFEVYEADWNGQKIEFKAKDTDGLILYNVRFIK